MTLTGHVVKRPFAQGSKSERDAVLLEVSDDKRYVLRRLGGNAFSDPVLDELIEKRIKCRGELHGFTFLMKDWEETE